MSTKLCKAYLIFQNEMDSTVDVWNNHLIRPSRTATSPYGRPNIMYTVPELCHTHDYLCPQSDNDIEICNGLVVRRRNIPCDEDVYDWCNDFMKERNLHLAVEANDAVNLYLTLRQSIKQFI